MRALNFEEEFAQFGSLHFTAFAKVAQRTNYYEYVTRQRNTFEGKY